MNFDLIFSNAEKKVPEIAVIGVGGFNHSLFVYGMRGGKVRIRALCGRNIQRCVDAFSSAGIPADKIKVCRDYDEGMAAYNAGRFLVFDDVSLAMRMPFDTVVEGTGNPEAAARHALAAIEHGKNIVMVTKESDSVAGPFLAKKARDKGLIYSLAMGDQPALLVSLASWAGTAGLTILSIGKSSEYDFVFDEENETMTVLEKTVSVPNFRGLWDLGPDAAETLKKRSRVLSAFGQRAIPDLTEMGIVCNHLPHIHPDVPSFHCPVARTVEIPDIMSPADLGGILKGTARIDVVNCLRRKDEQSMGGGVYLVVACDDKETWRVLGEKGMPQSRNGKTALIYYPAHYLGFEALFSVLSIAHLGFPTGSPEPRPRYDLVARTTKDLKKGACFKAQGHHHVIEGLEGLLLPAEPIGNNVMLPYYLADGTVLKRDLPAGTFLTADALEKQDDALLWELREEQDQIFFPR